MGWTIKAEILDTLIQISKKGRSNIYYFREHHPDLIEAAIRQFGSLENAITAAGIDYSNFFSGFDVETSPTLNRDFLNFVTKVLTHWKIFLDPQYLIRFDDPKTDPIRIDLERSRWYVIKILPWSKSTQNLILQIIPHTHKKIIIIHLRPVTNLPSLKFLVVNHISKYLQVLHSSPLQQEYRTLRAMLNVRKFEI